MATDKQIKLVEQLFDKTRKRILSWEPTAREDEFISTLGGNVSFTVRGANEGDVLIVRDVRDRVLVSVTADELNEISRLYAEVRRQALDVDESLDGVLEQLAKLDKR
jgi:hypothetical protein